jgi:hypothetical protein
MSVEQFYDAGGLELLRRRAELLGEAEDELEAALNDAARVPLSHRWTWELDTALRLIDIGQHDSALAHLVIALNLLITWAVPEFVEAGVTLPDLLRACPSLKTLAVVFKRAQEMATEMANGQPPPFAEALLVSEALARAIRQLTVVLPRSEIVSALEAIRGR